MNRRFRELFDNEVERVLATLPPLVHRLIEEVPLHVEDQPDPDVCESMGFTPDTACGLYSGVTHFHRGADVPPLLPDVVTIYRRGISNIATRADGSLDREELRKQIRITILHEIGHHHGLSEEDLEELGYA